MTMEIQSLASRCRNVIASNIERYPVETIGSLPYTEWEAIVKVKCSMTAPKSQTNAKVKKVKGSCLLSDGRKFPVLSEKFIREVEEKNKHLKFSALTDELVWRDCVDFKFKQVGSLSRPSIFRLPWDIQVKSLKQIAEDIQTLRLIPDTANNVVTDGSDSSTSSSSPAPNNNTTQMKKIAAIVEELQTTPMIVPLLSASGIGKALKKLIKKLRAFDATMNTITDDTTATNKTSCYLTWSTQLENILQQWKEMASESGVAISSNKQSSSPSSPQLKPTTICARNGRHTSPEQHEEDVKNIQKCKQWRDLFDILVTREKRLIENRGAKMRESRKHLAVVRPKISTASTKKRGRMVINEIGGIQRLGAGGPPNRKLGKLRQEFQGHKIAMNGGKRNRTYAASSGGANGGAFVPRASFGASVSSVIGSSKKRNRDVALGDGKKMKLPKTGKQYRRNMRR